MTAAQSPSLLQPVSSDLALTQHKQEWLVDSRLLARQLGNHHRQVMVLIKKFEGKHAANTR